MNFHRIRVTVIGLILAAGALMVAPRAAFAAGTQFVTNGSTQIGTFPSALPNTSFRIDTSVTNAAVVTTITPSFVGPSSATLASATGWTQLQNASADDAFKAVPFGFNITFNGVSRNTAYIGSNTYITFGTGSNVYSGLSASQPPYPGVHLAAADNSYQKVLYKLDSAGVIRVRYEGNNSTSGTLGSPTIVYEAVFYSGLSYFDIHMGANSRAGGDATPPTITSISSDKAAGSYKVGEVIDIDVTFSETVTSTGNVTVTLETGATDRTCSFTVTSATTGTCNYTVQAGDTSADLTVNTVSGTIRDVALNAMTNFVPATNLAANEALVIDTTAPTITSISSDKAAGSYKAGDVIDIDVTFSEVVTSTGNVTVTLETGVTDQTCTFTVTSANTGTCNYTVQAGDASADLTVNTVSGTIRDVALNTMTSFTPGTNLAVNEALVIDNVLPTITSISSDKVAGSYKAGDVIDIDVTFSEIVTSTGNVTVTLETGTTDRTCTFTVTSATTGTCNYTVQAGDASADLTVNSVSGTIRDAALNTMTNFTPGTNLAANEALVIDTVVPTIVNASSDKANGTYAAGEVIDIDITFSEAVTSTGNVTVTLETGATDRTCTFTVTSATTGTCNYTVQAGDVSADLTVNSVTGTIRDAALNAIVATLPTTNLAANKALVIDTTAPTITNVSSDKANGSYKPGDIIDIDVTFSEVVTSTGNVTVTLETGTVDRTCTFVVTGATTGTCNYVVQTGDTTADLNVASISGTIRDVALNAMTNFVPTTNLAANKALVIDATAPTVTGVSSSTANGAYKAGQTVSIQVTFSESVTVVGGTPTLTLATGSPAVTAVNYVSGSPGTTLTFDYTVSAGNVSADLDYASTGSLALGGATIRDAGGNDATLTLAAPGAANSLGANKALVIDTTAPTVVLTSTAPNLTNVSPIPVTATFSESVTGFDVTDIVVTNGTAGSFSGSGSAYTFSVTPSGQGAVTVSVPSSSGQDAATNSNSASNNLSRTYDSVVPTVSIATSSPNPTNVTPVSYTATFSEAVTGFVLADIVATGGTPGNFATVSSTVYTFDISPVGAPDVPGYTVVTVSVPASKAQDAAGNNNSASNSGTPHTFNFDNLSSTVALTAAVLDPTNTSPFTVTGTFNESVTGFDINDITVTGGTKGNFVVVSTSVYTVDITPTAQGPVNISVPANAALDAALNQSLVSNLLTRVFDTESPSTTLSSTASSTTNTSPIPVTATFGTAVTGFVVGDITVTNGSAGNFVATSDTVYTFDITPAGQGTVSVDVSAGVATDPATNGNLVAAQLSRTYDSVAPTLAVSAAVTTPTNDTTPAFSFTSNEAGTISYSGDCSSGTTSAISGTNAIEFATLSAGTHNNCTLRVTDAAGNQSAHLAVGSFFIDVTAPTLTSITLDDTALKVGDTAQVTITFSEPVTAFDNADVTTIENGTLSTLSSGNGGSIWSGTFTPSASTDDSSNVITVTLTGLTDLAGNAGVGTGSSSNYTVDTVRPSLSIGAPSASVTTGTSVTYTVTFTGASAISLVDGDVTVVPTASALGTATVSGSGLSTRTITVSSISGNGTLAVAIAAGTASDAAGNTALAPTAGSSFTVDTAAPTLSSIVFGDSALKAGETSLVTFTYSEAITGFTNADITTLENATLTAVATGDGGTTWTATLTPTASFEDSSNLLTVNLPGIADVAGNPGVGTMDSGIYTIDTLRPTVTNVSSDKLNGNYETGEVIDIDVTFSEAVTSTGNVTVTLETGTVDRTCTFTVTSATTGTCNYTVQSGDVTADLDVASIAGTIADAAQNAMTVFTPTTSLATNKAIAIVNTIPTIVNISSDKPDSTYKTGEVIDIDVTFSEAVTSTGNVTVTLETGTVDRTCTFTVTSATTGTCNYTVQAGDVTTDLSATISGTIQDSSSNPITNFVPATGLAANKALVVDTVAPTIVSISSDASNTSYVTGQTIDIDVTFSEAVTSVGNVRITLETGDDDQSCSFAVTNSSTGTCDYVVQQGDLVADLNVSLVEGDINDGALNAMTNFVPTTNLAGNKDIAVIQRGASIPQPAVTMAAPNGGERLRAGSKVMVLWSSSNVGTVKVSLSTDGGATFPTIVYEGEASLGAYEWTVPDRVTSAGRIKIEGSGGSPVDASDTAFSIISAYGVTLTTPNGGEALVVGRASSITWSTDSTLPHTVSLQLSTNGGNSYPVTIATNIADTGSYSWTVPDGVSGNLAKVRVQILADGAVKATDVSDATFTIGSSALPPPPTAPVLGPTTPPLPPSKPTLPVAPSIVPTTKPTTPGTPPSTGTPQPGTTPGINPEAPTGTPTGGALLDPAAIVDFLRKNGILLGNNPIGPDGKLTSEAVRALTEFQEANSDDGELGPATRNFINALLRRGDGKACRTTFFNLVPPVRRLERTLKFGDRHPDVLVLQKFLNANGFLLASSGPGAPGRETILYSELTRAALSRFQNAYSLRAEKGTIGPLTSFFIRDLSSQPPVFVCQTLVPPISALGRDLRVGSRGEDVRVLQRFLNDNGFLLATVGPGAPGGETNNYQQATLAAITRFQNAYGLAEEAGRLGPLTRAFLNGLRAPAPNQTPATTTPATPTKPATPLTAAPNCPAYLTGFVRPGAANDRQVVRKLQDFLRVEEKFKDVVTNGMYNEVTQAAVRTFQQRYAVEILAPIGLTEGTGQVLESTVAKINRIVCEQDANAVR